MGHAPARAARGVILLGFAVNPATPAPGLHILHNRRVHMSAMRAAGGAGTLPARSPRQSQCGASPQAPPRYAGAVVQAAPARWTRAVRCQVRDVGERDG